MTINFNKNISEKKNNQYLKDIEYYGYTKIENFLNKKQVSYLLKLVNNEYKDLNEVKKIKYKGVPSRNSYDKIVYNLYNLDHAFIKLLSQESIQNIAKGKLNDPYYRYLHSDLPNYCLSYYNARSSGKKLDFHIDSHIPYLSDNIFAMQFTFLLEKSTIENGCTIAVPGSHKSGKFTDRDFSNYKNLTGSPGDLLIWDSRIWHGTNDNISKRSRWALIATLTSWWLKPAVDIIRSINPDIYDKCSDNEKLLLGFCSIPPTNIFERNNTKNGYDFLKKNLSEYDFKK